jgi:hypothetical protein
MEKLPNTFHYITHFSVEYVNKKYPRFDYITKLTLKIESELPKGKYSLTLIEPFPPKCRGGEKLSKLQSLDHKEIESISPFPSSNGEKNERIEIQRKASGTTIFVKCKRIEGIPGWN